MDQPTTVRALRPGQKNLTLQFIVLDVSKEPHKTRDGNEIYQLRVADQTASVTLSLYNDWGKSLKPSDVCRLCKGTTQIFKGTMQLSMPRYGNITKIGEFCMLFVELPDMSSKDMDFLQELMESQGPNRNSPPPPLHGSPADIPLPPAPPQHRPLNQNHNGGPPRPGPSLKDPRQKNRQNKGDS